MGGKKKSLANRLARMSDEERARYLQHKADIEEEARRRKEQLIAIFMKHKIKREDGFSRLNLAKINQHWHQILRLNKCKEMREDVEHMKQFMDRTLEYKNRTIARLLEELELAEEQYCHNFQAHVTHIDQIIGSHEKYMSLMEEEFQKDLDELLAASGKEHDEIIQNSISRHEHLQTVIFGQNSQAKEAAKANFERYLRKKEELTSTFRIELASYTKRRQSHCAALWRQIATAIKSSVSQTDTKRLHLAELNRLDAESAAEIALNQERITLQEEAIKTLTQHLENLTTKRTEHIAQLKATIAEKTATFYAVRQQFRKDVAKDERQLLHLTHISNKSIEFLHRIQTRGVQIVNLMKTCRKFETQREKIKFLPLEPQDLSLDEEEQEEVRRRSSGKSAPEEVKKIVISRKQSSPESQSPEPEDIVGKEFALLDCMEMFWVAYNRVDLEHREMKEERRVLQGQNKHIRGMIRAVLEAVALDQSPASKVPTRAVSKTRGAKSAPLRRILV
ncbi:dynein regulatory complex subunit 2 isoform X2 [Tribolium castaneum]|uniref:dynein regulatory complex subunit 2 isoform X2 n=1 Tax=Tribolium castaneum TaxID=7070 RepID=UPI00077DE794|nr:PREDICTED: coiled-coil domain-containing protein 65 isoform X2 [Tribolium castaneum]|eukprot:XP_015838433.1 PREDICTED: coiled-coil domain-containing protein 65 isoform X2 [Tribolium castaneum]